MIQNRKPTNHSPTVQANTCYIVCQDTCRQTAQVGNNQLMKKTVQSFYLDGRFVFAIRMISFSSDSSLTRMHSNPSKNKSSDLSRPLTKVNFTSDCSAKLPLVQNVLLPFAQSFEMPNNIHRLNKHEIG